MTNGLARLGADTELDKALPTRWQATLDQAGFTALLIVVILAPWPLGSFRPWAQALLAAVVWCGLVMAALATASSSKQGGHLRFLPVVSLAGFAVLLILQLIPGLAPDGGTISIDPFATRRYLMATLTYAGAWVLVLLTVNSRERAARLLGAVVAVGVLQAVAAVVLQSSGARYELWYAAFDQGGRANGTFVNPDHLAAYMELTLAAGLGWLLAQFNPKEAARASGWQAVGSALLVFLLSPKMLLRLVLVVAVIALVMTHSRGGNGAFFLTLLVVGAIVAWRSQRLRRPALWLVASMALVDVLIIGQWVGLDRVVQRLRDTPVASRPASSPASSSTTEAVAFGTDLQQRQQPFKEQSLQERLQAPLHSLRLVAERPWLGHGGGTYITAFTPFKTEDMDGVQLQWDHAHNDYVQVACDTGLLGLALWLSIGMASAWRALALLRDSETAVNRGLAVAALMALGSIGLHSQVDFILHVPANALTFTVLLALPWAIPGGSGSGHRRKRQRSQAANRAAQR